MMARVKLTAGRVRDFSCESGKPQSFLWDSDVPGLAVRATANGAKSFVFQGKLARKSVRITIGDVRSWAIETGSHDRPGAREEARRLQTLVDKAIDPRHQKAEQIAHVEAQRVEADRQDMSVAELWPIYIDARRHKWSARHLLDHQNVADVGGRPVIRGKKGQTKEPGALAPMLPVRLSDITKEQVKSWLRDESTKHPTQAALAFRLFRAFLNWCNDTPSYAGIAASDACSARMARENLSKQRPKTDCLQREQLPAWFGSVRQIKNPSISTYLQILLLTGARREELADLKWGDIDFRWKSLTIRDKEESKGGEDGIRVIPLTPYVASLLSDLRVRNDTPPPRFRILHGKKIENDLTNWQPSPWVFSSSTSKSGRLQEPGIQHRKVCIAANIGGLSLHGLRRSFKTLTGWIECPTGVVAQIQGHKPSATAEKHYEVRPLDMLRMWHVRIEQWFLEYAGVQFAAEQFDAEQWKNRAKHVK